MYLCLTSTLTLLSPLPSREQIDCLVYIELVVHLYGRCVQSLVEQRLINDGGGSSHLTQRVLDVLSRVNVVHLSYLCLDLWSSIVLLFSFLLFALLKTSLFI